MTEVGSIFAVCFGGSGLIGGNIIFNLLALGVCPWCDDDDEFDDDVDDDVGPVWSDTTASEG